MAILNPKNKHRAKATRKNERKSSQSAELRERFTCDDNARVPRNTPKNDLNSKKFCPSPLLIKSLNGGVGISKVCGKERKQEISPQENQQKQLKTMKNDSVVH